MSYFSERSLSILVTCDPRLRALFKEIIKHRDCSIISGYRNEVEQNEKYRLHLSEKKWPDSKHNQRPSMAVDVAPYPIDWLDEKRFRYFAGFVMGIAASRGLCLRWGGDWDMNMNLDGRDLGHFEIMDNQE